ncbi:MAG: PEP-CTERM sorting domain-containing protein [Kiloniellaceae bacterium]
MKYGKQFGLTTAALAVAGFMSIGAAQAASSPGGFFAPGDNLVSDNDAEELIDNNGNGTLDVGDYLQGIIKWGTIENAANPGGASLTAGTVNELTGVFRVEVTSKTFQSVGLDGLGGTADDIFSYTFGADTSGAFQAAYGVAAGAVATFFEDTDGASQDYSRQGPPGDLLTGTGDYGLASDGTLVWVWGFAGDEDEQWLATGVQTPDASSVPGATTLAEFNFQLSSLFFAYGTLGQTAAGCVPAPYVFGVNENPCLSAAGDSLIDINGGGSVVAPAASSDWPVWTNTDITVNVVPEPGTFGMLGLGLVGLGWIVRKRQKNA